MDSSKALRVLLLTIIGIMFVMSGIHGTPGSLLAAILAPQSLASTSSTSTNQNTGTVMV